MNSSDPAFDASETAAPPETDAALVTACRDGDAAAWARLIARHGSLVRAVAVRAGLDAAEADDAVQEVFLALLRGLDGLRNPQGLVKWLLTTSDRVVRRAVAGRARRPVVDADGGPEPEDPAETTAEALAAIERDHRVRIALGALGPRCRDLLSALYGRGEPPPYERLGRALGMPVGSIGPTRARCLARLLEILESSERDVSANG